MTGRLARALLLVLAIHPATGLAAEVIGVATVAEGEAQLIRGTDLFALSPGVDIESGDVIATGVDSRAQLEMEDGTILEAGPSSKLHLSEYVLREDRSVQEAAVSVARGWLRFLTAKLRPASRYRFDASTATIGIRGTEGILEATADETRFHLTEGAVEAFEVDDAGNLGDAIAVTQGQYLRRRRAERAIRLRGPPAAFQARLPRQFRIPPGRQKARVARLKVKPRKLRAADYDDVKTLLEANPRIRKHLRGRFKSRSSDPTTRKQRREKHGKRADKPRPERREQVKEKRQNTKKSRPAKKSQRRPRTK